MQKITSQAEFIADYNKRHRPPFNPVLFNKDEQDIIEDLKLILLSCQREGYFTLKVEYFEEISNYKDIQDILYELEENVNEKGGKKKENPYELINLNKTDVKLLIVNWYVRINDDEKEYDAENPREGRVKVVIAVPRIVDKYYMRINGNLYTVINQIVDGSTYNNRTSINAKMETVVMKTIFQGINIYRTKVTLTDMYGNTIPASFYRARIFNKTIPVVKYIFAKMGFNNGLNFLGLQHINVISRKIFEKRPDLYDNDNYYNFVKDDKCDIIVNVPKIIFNSDTVTQSTVYSIILSYNSNHTYTDVFDRLYWLNSLGLEYTKKFSEVKARTVLESLESIYDLKTKQITKLPPEYKETIYHILRWLIREFNRLLERDNLDITKKRIRWSEMIASLYSLKLSRGIYRITDRGKNVTVKKIIQAINTRPNVLISAITKCTLVNCNTVVSDNDAINVLKASYKGPSGLGESNSSTNGKQQNSAIPEIYRHVHHSQYGIIDLDSSTATDPGMTGMICPRTKIYENGYLSDYQEPNEWEGEYQEILDRYKALVNLKEIVSLKKRCNIDINVDESDVDDSIKTMQDLITPVSLVQRKLEESKIIESNDLFTIEQE